MRRAHDLVEHADLVNPGRRMRPSEALTDTRPGTRHGAAGSTAHAVDDRRDAHQDEVDRRFADDVAAQIDEVCMSEHCGRVVLVAPPAMLARLRIYNDVLLRGDREVVAVPKELTKLSRTDLHDHLAKDELLPQRWRPTL